MTLTVQSGHGLAGGSGTTMNISKPTGLAEGDLMVAVIASGRNNADLSSPAGWDEITVSNSTYPLSVFSKLAEASDVAASTVRVHAIFDRRHQRLIDTHHWRHDSRSHRIRHKRNQYRSAVGDDHCRQSTCHSGLCLLR